MISQNMDNFLWRYYKMNLIKSIDFLIINYMKVSGKIKFRIIYYIILN